jgi:large subunit ribosomal protein L28
VARKCSVCGKGTISGKSVARRTTHTLRVSLRRFKPNLQKVKAITDSGPRRVYVCTSCLRSGKVQRAV